MWILAEDSGEVINLNYVSRIYAEFAIKDGESYKIVSRL